jgi:membrane protein insertase Oxa1/YidC/SpoIIIJ
MSSSQQIPSQNETTPSNSNNAQKQLQKSHNGSAVRITQNPVRNHQQVIVIKPKAKRKVTELRCAEIRWFYKRKEDTKWLPFQGLLTFYYIVKNLGTICKAFSLFSGVFLPDEYDINRNYMYMKKIIGCRKS